VRIEMRERGAAPMSFREIDREGSTAKGKEMSL